MLRRRLSRRLTCALRFAALACALAALTAAPPRGAEAQPLHDPTLVWTTLETPHFRIHYYQDMREIADRVAAVCEGVYERIGDLMGRRPTQVTEVVLSDNTDDANGSANAFPYNTMRLYITAPEDLAPLADFDDWLQTLITHEYTHIAHLDNVSGLPAIINAILGKVYRPNQDFSPRWLTEGIAVYAESRHTTAGRLRSSVWDMYLRADALENRLVPLDALAGGQNRWPHGDIYYLYGAHFVEYIVRRFGEQTLGRIATTYGREVIPYGVNRALFRATGFTYEQLYGDFMRSLRAHYGAQRAQILAAGLREGERITFQGETVAYPRFLGDGHTIAYESDNGHSNPQIRTLDVGQPGGPRFRPRDGEWVAAFSGFGVSRDGTRMIVSDLGFYRDIYAYRELYERRVRLEPSGRLAVESNVKLTDGSRTMYPDVSPDDDHVAFAVNHRGTSSLFEMSLTDRRPVPLLRVRRFEQVFTPRYSPDGRQIVFSQWQRGGFRDIRLLDRATGRVRDLTHDRAVDMHPVFTPDGRYVVFSSDRAGGVHNLFAYELATDTVHQVTNVVSGAFMPAISPDGRTLVYVGYTSLGYDLFRMTFDPAQWTLAPAGPLTRPGASTLPTPPVRGRTHPYNPWPTFRPQFWYAGVGNDGFGPTVSLITFGGDVLGYHGYNASVTVGLSRGDPGFDLTYVYRGVRPALRMHLYRAVNAGSWRVGAAEPAFPVDRWGGEAEVSVNFPQLFAGNSLAFSYEAQYVTSIGGLPFGRYIDPNEPATVPPFRGWTSSVRGSWRFSRVQRYTYDISQSRGYELFASVRGSDRAIGSSVGSIDFTWAGAAYIALPWGLWRRPHVVALRLAGGYGTTDRGDRALFYLGGFPAFSFGDFVNQLISFSNASGVALRGYPQFARGGSEFYLLNVEYRFPIVQIDRGAATLPLHISRLYGTVFGDVGNAFFGPFRPQDLAVGVGAELFLDMVIGYFIPITLRGGFAYGITGADGGPQGYLLLGAPF